MVFLFINSADRLSSSTSTTNAVFNLQTPIPNIKSVKLLSFTFEDFIPNIVTGVNDKVVWNRTATDFSHTVPQEQWTISNLLSNIQTGMNAADANNYALSYSAN